MRTESILAVQAELEREAEETSHIPGIDHHGRFAWMLGCATARLAMANQEINRLEGRIAEMTAIAEAHDARR